MTELMKKAIERRDERYRTIGTLYETHARMAVGEWMQAPSLVTGPFKFLSYDGDPAFAWICTGAGAHLTLTPEECSRKIFSIALRKKKLKLQAWLKIPEVGAFSRVRYTREDEIPRFVKDAPKSWHRVEERDIEVEIYE